MLDVIREFMQQVGVSKTLPSGVLCVEPSGEIEDSSAFLFDQDQANRGILLLLAR